MLTQEQLHDMLDYNKATGVFKWKIKRPHVRVGQVAGFTHADGYTRIKLNSVAYGGHRLAWLYVHGVWPSNEIDHINRVRDDNRIDNLRDATHEQNTQNASIRADNSSGYKGVCWDKENKKWKSRIMMNNKQVLLGRFKYQLQAVNAYQTAAIVHQKDFAPQ